MRAIIIGLLIIPINYYWRILSTIPGQYQSVPIGFALFYNVIFIMFILVGVNFLVKKLASKYALRQKELVVIYVILSFTTAVGGLDMMQTLPPMMEHAFEFATPENDWEHLFHRHIPAWLSVSNKSILKPYFEGETSFYQSEYVLAWLKPALIWSVFVIVLVFVMLCITVVVRRNWVEQTKLSFPIIQLPLEMTDDKFSLFRNKLTWVGFAISGGIALLNGLHNIYPAIPQLRIAPWYHNLVRYFPDKPWNAIGRTNIGILPSIVGISFFMPLDLSFSCWFFYLLWKVQRVLFTAFGTQAMANVQIHNIAFLNQQTFGAAMGIAFLSLWLGRDYFLQLIKALFNRSKSNDLRDETGYRQAILGSIIGISFLFLFSWQAGMKPWVIWVFFTLYYAFAITVARLRAELGTPVHDFHYTSPDQVMVDVFGSKILGSSSLTIFSLFHWFNRTYRAHPMPHQIEGFKLAARTGVTSKRLFYALLIALLVGVPVFFWVYLHISYKFQGSMLMRFAAISYRNLETQLTYKPSFDFTAVLSTLFGFLMTLILMFLRVKFIWWNLHPAGYVISSSFSMNVCWFSVFVSWFLKYTILRAGGLKLFQRSSPLFLGLILGQFIVAGFWSIVGVALGRTFYIFSW